MDGFNYIINKFNYNKPLEYYSQSDYETVMYKPEFTELLRSFDSDRVLGMFLDDNQTRSLQYLNELQDLGFDFIVTPNAELIP